MPTVLTYHSDIIKQRFLYKLYAPLMDLTLDSMTAIVATSSNYAKTSVVLSDPRFCNKVKNILLGIEDRVFATYPNPKTLNDFGFKDNELFFYLLVPFGAIKTYKH